MKEQRRLLWVVVLSLAAVLRIPGQDKSPLKLIQKIAMPNVKGRLDHLGIDLEGRRLFVAALGEAQNTVEVIDLKTGKRVFSIPGQSMPQGVFYSPDFKKLFVANGLDGTCKIFAGDTFKLIESLPVGAGADHVGYDASTKYLYVGFAARNPEGWLSSIRAPTDILRISKLTPAQVVSKSKRRGHRYLSHFRELPILV